MHPPAVDTRNGESGKKRGIGKELLLGAYILRLAEDGKLPSGTFIIGPRMRKKSAKDEVVVSLTRREGEEEYQVEVKRQDEDLTADVPGKVFRPRRSNFRRGVNWKERIGVVDVDGRSWISFKSLEDGKDSRLTKSGNPQTNRKGSPNLQKEGKKDDVAANSTPVPAEDPLASEREDQTEKTGRFAHSSGEGNKEKPGESVLSDTSRHGSIEIPAKEAAVGHPRDQQESTVRESCSSRPGGSAAGESSKACPSISTKPLQPKDDASEFFEIFGCSMEEGRGISKYATSNKDGEKAHSEKNIMGCGAEYSSRKLADANGIMSTTRPVGRFSKNFQSLDSDYPIKSNEQQNVSLLQTNEYHSKKPSEYEKTARKRPRRSKARTAGSGSSDIDVSGGSDGDEMANAKSSTAPCSPSTDQTDTEGDAVNETDTRGPFEKITQLRDPKKLIQATRFLKGKRVLTLQPSEASDDELTNVPILEYLRVLCVSYTTSLRSWRSSSDNSKSFVYPTEDEWETVSVGLGTSKDARPPLLGIKDVSSLAALLCSSLHIPDMRTTWYAVASLKRDVIDFCVTVIGKCQCLMKTVNNHPDVLVEKSKPDLFSAAAACSRTLSALIVHESNLPFPDAGVSRRLSRRPTKTGYLLEPQSEPSHAYELLVLEKYSVVSVSRNCLDLVVAAEKFLRRATTVRNDLVTLVEAAVLYKTLWKGRDGAFGLALESAERQLIIHHAFFPQALQHYLRPFRKDDPRTIAFVAQLTSNLEFLRRLGLISPDHRLPILTVLVDRLSLVSVDPVRRCTRLSDEERENLQLPKKTLGAIDAVVNVLGLAAMQREVIGSPGLRQKFLKSLKSLFAKVASIVRDSQRGMSAAEVLEVKLPEEKRVTVTYAAKLLGAIARSMENTLGEPRAYTLKFLISDLCGSQRQLETLAEHTRLIQGAVEHGDINDKERGLMARTAVLISERLKQGSQRRQGNDDKLQSRELMWSDVGPDEELKDLKDKLTFEWKGYGRAQVLGALKQSLLKDDDMESDGCILKLVMEVRDEDHRRFVDHEKSPSAFKRLTRNEYVGDARKFLPRVPTVIPCTCVPGLPGYIGGAAVGCSNKACSTRSILYECDPGKCGAKETCSNQRFQKQQYAPFKVSVASNPALGFGIKAAALIPKGTFIAEYQGEVITEEEYEHRKLRYQGEKHFYFMNLVPGLYLDASRKGLATRFINHSCDPSATTEKWIVRGEPRIGIFAIREIAKGEEVTFDYRSSRNGSHLKSVRCLCGTAKCRGFLVGGEDDSAESSAEETGEEEYSPPEEKAELATEAKVKKITSAISYAKETLQRLQENSTNNAVNTPSKEQLLRAAEWENRLTEFDDPDSRKVLALEVQRKELHDEMSNVPSIPRRSPLENDMVVSPHSAVEDDESGLGIPRKRPVEDETGGTTRAPLKVEPEWKRAHVSATQPSSRADLRNNNETSLRDRSASKRTRTLGRPHSKILRMDYNSKSRQHLDRECELGEESECYSTCSSPAPVYDDRRYGRSFHLDGPESESGDVVIPTSGVASGYEGRKRRDSDTNGGLRQRDRCNRQGKYHYDEYNHDKYDHDKYDHDKYYHDDRRCESGNHDDQRYQRYQRRDTHHQGSDHGRVPHDGARILKMRRYSEYNHGRLRHVRDRRHDEDRFH